MVTQCIFPCLLCSGAVIQNMINSLFAYLYLFAHSLPKRTILAIHQCEKRWQYDMGMNWISVRKCCALPVSLSCTDFIHWLNVIELTGVVIRMKWLTKCIFFVMPRSVLITAHAGNCVSVNWLASGSSAVCWIQSSHVEIDKSYSSGVCRRRKVRKVIPLATHAWFSQSFWNRLPSPHENVEADSPSLSVCLFSQLYHVLRQTVFCSSQSSVVSSLGWWCRVLADVPVGLMYRCVMNTH